MRFIYSGPLVIACACGAAFAQTTNFQFAPAETIFMPTGQGPTHMAVGDLNGDRQPDLLFTGRNEKGTLLVSLANLAGGFGPFQSIVVGEQTDWAELRDLNGDGKLDAIIAARGALGKVIVMFGDGAGGFGPPVFYQAGRETRGVVLLDFENDGDLDVAALNHVSADVTLLMNMGGGALAPAGRIQVNQFVGAVPYPQQILAGDLDEDGRQDLVISSIGAKRVAVLRNQGGGVFGPEEAYAPPFFKDVQGAVMNSVLGDINGDGDIDIVSSLLFGTLYQQFSVLSNDGESVFSAPSIFMGSFDGFAWSPTLGDIDGDGDADVVMANALPGWVSVADNVTPAGGAPAFAEPQMIGPKNFLRDVATVDIDNDCDLDVLALEFTTDALVILRNQTPQQSGCNAGLVQGRGRAAPPNATPPPPTILPAELKGVTDSVQIARFLGGMQ